MTFLFELPLNYGISCIRKNRSFIGTLLQCQVVVESSDTVKGPRIRLRQNNRSRNENPTGKVGRLSYFTISLTHTF